MNQKKAEESYKTGKEYFIKGEFDRALRHFNYALNNNPNYSEVLSDKGAVLAKLGKYEKALETLNKALDYNPNLTIAISNRKYVLKKLGKSTQLWPKKKKELIEENPLKLLKIEELYNKGTNYALEGDFQKAIEFHQKAVELEPQFADGWINLGGDYANINDFEKALKYFDKAIELDPQNYRSWSNKGFVIFKQRKFEEAFICYNEAFKLNSEDAQVKNNRGYILQELAKKKIKTEDELLKQLEGFYPRSAINEMVNEIEKKQRSMEVLNTITGKNASEKEDTKHKPKELGQQAKKFNKGLIEEKLSIAEELIYDGDYEQVIQLCDEILDSDKTNPYAWFWKGKALTALARNKEAFQCYMNAKNMKNKGLLMNNMSISEKLLRSDKDRIERRKMKFPDETRPWLPDADNWNKNGAYIQTMGKFEAALYCYDNALEINPNYKPALRNKKRIIKLLEKEGMRY